MVGEVEGVDAVHGEPVGVAQLGRGGRAAVMPKFAAPVPATVLIFPSTVTFRTRLLLWSEI